MTKSNNQNTVGRVAVTHTLPEARCPCCNKLLGYDVSGARFKCPRCKAQTQFIMSEPTPTPIDLN